MIPDDEHKLIDNELVESGLGLFLPTWQRVELACRELRGLRADLVAARERIRDLESRLADLSRPHDVCPGRMDLTDVDDGVYTFRCAKCGASRTDYSRPARCGRRIN